MSYSIRPEGHPQFEEYYDIFVKCRDCYSGEDQIKKKGEDYL